MEDFQDERTLLETSGAGIQSAAVMNFLTK
jgi:hypothetical protein